MNDLTMMLAIHDAFRRDLRRLAASLHAAADQPIPTARAMALAERWQYLCDQISHHHHGEDELLWPALREHLGPDREARAVLDEMQDEHRALEPVQTACQQALQAFLDAPSATRAAEATERHRTFVDVFEDHLAHEERVAVPLLERRLPAAALRRFSAQQQRTMGIRAGLTQFFPWVLDAASPQRERIVLGQLPPPLRIVVRRARDRYARTVAAAWA